MNSTRMHKSVGPGVFPATDVPPRELAIADSHTAPTDPGLHGAERPMRTSPLARLQHSPDSTQGQQGTPEGHVWTAASDILHLPVAYVSMWLSLHSGGPWDLEMCRAAFSGHKAGGVDAPPSCKCSQKCEGSCKRQDSPHKNCPTQNAKSLSIWKCMCET